MAKFYRNKAENMDFLLMVTFWHSHNFSSLVFISYQRFCLIDRGQSANLVPYPEFLNSVCFLGHVKDKLNSFQ